MNSILSKRKTINEFQKIDPILFEEFVADIWKKLGFDVNLRKATGDRGVDFEATLGGKLYLIQAKRYNSDNNVGSQEVRNYATLYQQVPEADNVLIVTTSGFTKEAQKLAEDLDVDIIDSNELFNIIDKYAADIAIEYLQDISKSNNYFDIQDINQNDTHNRTSPFNNENIFRRIGHNQSFFELCPECSHETIWLGQEKEGSMNGIRHLKCSYCEAHWKEVIEEKEKEIGLIFTETITQRNKIGWKQCKGSKEGTVLTAEEWT